MFVPNGVREYTKSDGKTSLQWAPIYSIEEKKGLETTTETRKIIIKKKQINQRVAQTTSGNTDRF